MSPRSSARIERGTSNADGGSSNLPEGTSNDVHLTFWNRLTIIKNESTAENETLRLMDVQVISVSYKDAGSSLYYVIPEERSDEAYYVSDLKNFDGPIKKFITITGYTGWMQENPNVNVTSFWETVV